jgi:GGDEF domain-containing protein
MGAISRSMKGIIKGTLRLEGDAVFGDSGEMMIILVGCDKEGALSAENRLRETLDEYSTIEKLPQEIKLRFGSAVYPDEAKNCEALIHKAREV